jgi:hypothetical protein
VTELLAAPRLPDGDYLELRVEQPEPEQAWQYVLGWLPLGWCMAPPAFEPQGHKCFVVAYNVRGCLEGPSYVRGAADTIDSALIKAGWDLEPWTEDDECPRNQYRKLQ